MRSSRLALAVTAIIGGWLAMPAGAAGPVSPKPPSQVEHGRMLSTAHPVLKFAGRMHNPVPIPMASDPDPTACLVNCQLWTLRVSTGHPFLVAVHNATDSVDDGFDLSVYDPAGNQVASADGIGANGQAVVVHPGTHGDYTVAVTMTYAYDTDAGYLGEARVMSGRSWRAAPRCRSAKPCQVLPKLAVRAAADVHVDGIPPVAAQRADAQLLLRRRDGNDRRPSMPSIHERDRQHGSRTAPVTDPVDDDCLGDTAKRVRSR